MTTPCARPLAWAEFVEYWLERPAPERLDAIEEHLLACDACAAQLQEVAQLADGVRAVARAGRLALVVPAAFLARAQQDGLRTRVYSIGPGERVHCTAGPDDDLVVVKLRADLGRATRVDLVSQFEGQPSARLADVPVDAMLGEVLLTERIDTLRARGREVLSVRLLAVEPDGTERTLGEYTLAHTPWSG